MTYKKNGSAHNTADLHCGEPTRNLVLLFSFLQSFIAFFLVAFVCLGLVKMPATLFHSELDLKLSPRQADGSFHIPSDLAAAATICLLLTTVAVVARTFINAVDLRRLQIDDCKSDKI